MAGLSFAELNDAEVFYNKITTRENNSSKKKKKGKSKCFPLFLLGLLFTLYHRKTER
jgi:hypothetical protein